MTKSETSSPKVLLEAMIISCAIDAKMLSCVINAKAGRYIVVTDIPGAFLHVDMNEELHRSL